MAQFAARRGLTNASNSMHQSQIADRGRIPIALLALSRVEHHPPIRTGNQTRKGSVVDAFAVSVDATG